MENDWVLYVAVREDLKSMNPGKALAHSGHAAMQATVYGKKYFENDFNEYLSQASDFGTQINLSIPYQDWFDLRLTFLLFGYNYKSNIVYDPTYPYVVNKELASLISDEIHTSEPIDIGKGNVLCMRNEATAIWFFVRKSDEFVLNYLKKYKLAK